MRALVIAAAAIVYTATSVAAANVDRGYDPVKSMYFDFQRSSMAEALAVERALRARGYDVGAVDGVLGPEARRALERFQHRHGLAATARVDGATIDALGIDAASASP